MNDQEKDDYYRRLRDDLRRVAPTEEEAQNRFEGEGEEFPSKDVIRRVFRYPSIDRDALPDPSAPGRNGVTVLRKAVDDAL